MKRAFALGLIAFLSTSAFAASNQKLWCFTTEDGINFELTAQMGTQGMTLHEVTFKSIEEFSGRPIPLSTQAHNQGTQRGSVLRFNLRPSADDSEFKMLELPVNYARTGYGVLFNATLNVGDTQRAGIPGYEMTCQIN